ncbi:MAG: hypothetical protein HQL17_00995 [Candidatus Omnitrophica bacterium]|nr:hypothetical protein [Candidatus Omnitrophota bacterium]
MLTPVPMEMLCVMVLDRDLDKVTELLLRREVLHLSSLKGLDLGCDALVSAGDPGELDRCRDMVARAQELFRKAGVPEVSVGFDDGHDLECADMEKMRAELDQISVQMAALYSEKDQLEARAQELREMHHRVSVLGSADAVNILKGRYSFMDICPLKLPTRNVDVLKAVLEGVAHVILPLKVDRENSVVIFIMLKKDRAMGERALSESGAEKISLPVEALASAQEYGQGLGDEIAGMEKQAAAIAQRISENILCFSPGIKRIWRQSAALASMRSAQGFFQKTRRTCCISGWIPVHSRVGLIEEVRSLVSGCYIDTWSPGQLEAVRSNRLQVPVLLSNPRLLRPFEMIVKNFGIPHYTAIDPTLFVAMSFLMMFGVMFGDAGQGLLLLTGGIWLTFRKNHMISTAGTAMACCGGASTVFGVLYGSVFGMEGIIPALWLSPLRSVHAFMTAALALGVLIISLGIVINVINCCRAEDVAAGVFGRSGVIAGFIYWTGLMMAVRWFIFSAPLDISLVVLLGGAVLTLMLKMIWEAFQAGQGVVIEAFKAGVEVMEMAIGFLSNTLSYLRLAAFALAHAGLFMVVFSLGDIVRHSMLGSWGGIAVLVLGNIFIVVLEGAVVTIQALRLEYYEFFSKFFGREGVLYAPVKFVA